MPIDKAENLSDLWFYLKLGTRLNDFISQFENNIGVVIKEVKEMVETEKLVSD